MRKTVFTKEKIQEIIAFYLAPHSLNDTAKFAQVSKNAIIKNLLLEHNIKIHSKEQTAEIQCQKASKVLENLLKDQELLTSIKIDYISNNLEFKEMLTKYNLTYATFARLLKKLGIKKEKIQQTDNLTKNKFKKYSVDTDKLQKYFDNHTVEETAEYFKIPIHFFYKVLNINEIDWTTHNKNIPNGSTPEDAYYRKLIEKYGKLDIVRQYKDERYPFHCDFYIKSEDKFIELNFHWTHGQHPYDPESSEDLQKLKIWQERAATNNFYKTAIKVWTVSDPLKLKYLKENNLNYQILY